MNGVDNQVKLFFKFLDKNDLNKTDLLLVFALSYFIFFVIISDGTYKLGKDNLH